MMILSSPYFSCIATAELYSSKQERSIVMIAILPSNGCSGVGAAVCPGVGVGVGDCVGAGEGVSPSPSKGEPDVPPLRSQAAKSARASASAIISAKSFLLVTTKYAPFGS